MRIFLFTILTATAVLCNTSLLKAQQTADSTGKGISADTTLTPEDSLRSLSAILSDLSSIEKKSYLMAQLSYLSNNVYQGRKDSATLPYIAFNLGYYFKSGFFIDGSVNYLADSSSRIDDVNLDAGYSFTAGNYSGEVVFTKYFYSSQSTNVKSNVKSSLSYFNSYDFGFITPTLTAFLNFGTKTDVGFSPGLEHSFFLLSDGLDITPTVTMNASSQNYYSNYYKSRSVKKKKTGVTQTASVSGVVLNASKVKILDYEASLPINYVAGKFTFSATPVYAMPVNPAVVEITTKRLNGISNTRTVTETLENTFFITLGISYRFGKS